MKKCESDNKNQIKEDVFFIEGSYDQTEKNVKHDIDSIITGIGNETEEENILLEQKSNNLERGYLVIF